MMAARPGLEARLSVVDPESGNACAVVRGRRIALLYGRWNEHYQRVDGYMCVVTRLSSLQYMLCCETTEALKQLLQRLGLEPQPAWGSRTTEDNPF